MHLLERSCKCSSNHSPLDCEFFSCVCSHNSSTVQSCKLLCEGRSRWQCCHLLGSSWWSWLWLHCHSELTRWNCYWWALAELIIACYIYQHVSQLHYRVHCAVHNDLIIGCNIYKYCWPSEHSHSLCSIALYLLACWNPILRQVKCDNYPGM